MLTVFLWIIFGLLILLLLAAIPPIRFGASAKYVSSVRFNYEFFVSYFHPMFLRLIYSSEHGGALKILGKTFKLKQKKEDERSSESSEYNENINKKAAEPQESESEPPIEYEEKSDYEYESAESQKRESAKVLEETREGSEPEEKRVPLFDRIKKRVNKIKRSKAYLFLSDAVWRKKIKSWLGRFLKGALTVVVFNRLRIRVKVGLKDPAALGKLCGYFGAVRSALSLHGRKADIALEPLFMRESLEFEAELRGGTSLLRAASCFFVAVLTFPYIRTYKLWRQKPKIV